MTTMIEIYHVPMTRSVRVIWTCEELALPYRLIPVDFSMQYRASPEWRRLSPTGKVPVMTDGDLTVFESGAMVQYLLDRYGDGRLQPPHGTAEHALFLQWCWFAESTYARPLGEVVNHRRVFDESEQRPEVIAEMQDRSRVCVDALAQTLEDHDYLLGSEFSAADIMTGYSLSLSQAFVPDDFPPSVAAYWQRLDARPGFQVARKA